MRKITLLTTLFVLFLSVASYAQDRGSRERMSSEERAKKTVEQLNKELTLTAKQQSELETFYKTSYKKRQDIMSKNRDNRDAMREQMKKSQQENEAELKKVLTADQFKKHQANEEKRKKEMEARRAKGDQGRGGQRPGGPGQQQ